MLQKTFLLISIVGEIPDKIIKYRFDEETRKELEETSWWNKCENWINANKDLFENKKKILEEISNGKN